MSAGLMSLAGYSMPQLLSASAGAMPRACSGPLSSICHSAELSNMKIMSVVGARPNFMKVAPIIAAIDARNLSLREEDYSSAEYIQHVLVHTGQHYDQQMSDSFFADLNLPTPDIHLGAGSSSHAVQ